MRCPLRWYDPWPIEWRCIRPFAHTDAHDVRAHHFAGLLHAAGTALAAGWYLLAKLEDVVTHRHKGGPMTMPGPSEEARLTALEVQMLSVDKKLDKIDNTMVRLFDQVVDRPSWKTVTVTVSILLATCSGLATALFTLAR